MLIVKVSFEFNFWQCLEPLTSVAMLRINGAYGKQSQISDKTEMITEGTPKVPAASDGWMS